MIQKSKWLSYIHTGKALDLGEEFTSCVEQGEEVDTCTVRWEENQFHVARGSFKKQKVSRPIVACIKWRLRFVEKMDPHSKLNRTINGLRESLTSPDRTQGSTLSLDPLLVDKVVGAKKLYFLSTFKILLLLYLFLFRLTSTWAPSPLTSPTWRRGLHHIVKANLFSFLQFRHFRTLCPIKTFGKLPSLANFFSGKGDEKLWTAVNACRSGEQVHLTQQTQMEKKVPLMGVGEMTWEGDIVSANITSTQKVGYQLVRAKARDVLTLLTTGWNENASWSCIKIWISI